jgi:energy-coupling factor transporter ATP-binding protein EcfA2
MSFASFHVFLSHNSADKPAVEELARRLKTDGIEAWLDKWHLVPGQPWQSALEQALADSLSVAVFIGPSGISPWQDEEMRAAISKRVRQKDNEFRVIPVLLPGGTREERSRLPEFLIASTWVEFRNSLDEEEAYHRLKSGVLGVAPGLPPGAAIFEGECPYRGLQAFQPEHSAFFFGREARIEWLLNALRPAQSFDRSGAPRENRFLAIVGASGSGKSSLARAGLIPALRNGKLEGSANWPILICRPGHDPLESLAVALAGDPQIGAGIGDVGNLISQMSSDETRLHLAVRVALAGADESQRVVLLVDQFEEVFTFQSDGSSKSRSSSIFINSSQMHISDDRRKAFIDNLLYAAGIPGGKVIVVLTMRADFYGRCALHRHLGAAITDHQELVGPMSTDELREVIERPAQLVGLELERGLTEMLLNEMEDQAGALPLLQHALWELWQRREGRRLTISAYKGIGGLEGALEQQANSIYDQLSKTEQETCRRVFLRLTQPGEGSEDTKRRVPLNQLGDPKLITPVINRLTNVRLITSEKDSFIEVSHEALIRSWTRLRSWIEEDREALKTQHRLTEAAVEWIRSSHDQGYLYQGARLAEAEEWSNTPEADLTYDERQFLNASLEQRDRVKREEAKRQAREVETLKKRPLLFEFGTEPPQTI